MGFWVDCVRLCRKPLLGRSGALNLELKFVESSWWVDVEVDVSAVGEFFWRCCLFVADWGLIGAA